MRPWLIFLALLFIAFNVFDFIGYCWGEPVVERLPVSGLFLELFGLFLVFIGIGDRLKFWGESTSLGRLHRFLRKLFRQDVVVHMGSGELKAQAATVDGSGSVGTATPGDRTLQQQIDDLWAYIIRMRKEIADQFKRLEERLQENIAELREEIRRVERTMTERVETLEAKVKRSDIGNVHMDTLGRRALE